MFFAILVCKICTHIHCTSTIHFSIAFTILIHQMMQLVHVLAFLPLLLFGSFNAAAITLDDRIGSCRDVTFMSRELPGSTACVSDFIALESHLNSLPCTHWIEASDIGWHGDNRLRRGVHCFRGLGARIGKNYTGVPTLTRLIDNNPYITLTDHMAPATLTFDAEGDPDAEFVIGFAVTSGVRGLFGRVSMFLANGAQAKNIFWHIGQRATVPPPVEDPLNTGQGKLLIAGERIRAIGTFIVRSGASHDLRSGIYDQSANYVITVHITGRLLSTDYMSDVALPIFHSFAVPFVDTTPLLGYSGLGQMDCLTSNWTASSICSGPCGSITQTRSLIEVAGPGAPACPLSRTIGCRTSECSVDCVQTGEWSPCSIACANAPGQFGTQSITRTTTTVPLNAGVACLPAQETRQCGTELCCSSTSWSNCSQSDWTDWTTCTTSCSPPGVIPQQTRARVTLVAAKSNDPACGVNHHVGTECGPISESRNCAIEPCIGTTCGHEEIFNQAPVNGSNDEMGLALTGPSDGNLNFGVIVYDRVFCSRRMIVALESFIFQSQPSGWPLQREVEYFQSGIHDTSKWICNSLVCIRDNSWQSTTHLELIVTAASTTAGFQLIFQNLDNKATMKMAQLGLGYQPLVYVQQYIMFTSSNYGSPIPDSGTRRIHGDGWAIAMCEDPDPYCLEPGCEANVCTHNRYLNTEEYHYETASLRRTFKSNMLVGLLPRISIDCVQTENVTACSIPCADSTIVSGTQSVTRITHVESAYYGTACLPLEEVRICNTFVCPLDCVQSDWSEWGQCNSDCTQTRTRSITYPGRGGIPCGPTYETRACPNDGCAGLIGSLHTQLGACRHLTIASPILAPASAQCAADFTSIVSYIQAQPCLQLPSAQLSGTYTPGVYCTSSAFVFDGPVTLDAQGDSTAEFVFISGSTSSSVLLISSTQLIREAQLRNVFLLTSGGVSVNQSSTAFGTILDIGNRTTTTYSSTHVPVRYLSLTNRLDASGNSTFLGLPQDCLMSHWTSQQNRTNTSCGESASEHQTRFVVRVGTGSVCPTSSTSRTVIPVNCCESEWSEWSQCSVVCGSGIQARSRMVTQLPLNGGTRCGSTLEQRACDSGVLCPIDCIQSEWSRYGLCSLTCGGGIQTRTRDTLVEAANGGIACGPTVGIQACNIQVCPKYNGASSSSSSSSSSTGSSSSSSSISSSGEGASSSSTGTSISDVDQQHQGGGTTGTSTTDSSSSSGSWSSLSSSSSTGTTDIVLTTPDGVSTSESEFVTFIQSPMGIVAAIAAGFIALGGGALAMSQCRTPSNAKGNKAATTTTTSKSTATVHHHQHHAKHRPAAAKLRV